jgi:hypothetical protein
MTDPKARDVVPPEPGDCQYRDALLVANRRRHEVRAVLAAVRAEVEVLKAQSISASGVTLLREELRLANARIEELEGALRELLALDANENDADPSCEECGGDGDAGNSEFKRCGCVVRVKNVRERARALLPAPRKDSAALLPRKSLAGVVCEKPGCNKPATSQCGSERWALCDDHRTDGGKEGK